MKIKQLAKHEMNDLEMTTNLFIQEVEAALSKMKDEKVRLFLPQNDKYRLLKLKLWTEKYSVDLYYIISKLVPIWASFIRRQSKALKSQGLGVRVATLTGKKSEQLLQDLIAKDFSSDQNKLLHRINEQNRILNEVVESKDGIKTESDSVKNILDFPSPKGYMRYYKRRIRRQLKYRNLIIEEMMKYPYRGNPFI